MKKLLLPIIALALSLSSCTEETISKGTVNIKLSHKVGDENLALESRTYTHPAGYAYKFNSVKYFISDISLIHVNEEVISLLDQPHLVDANREETLTIGPVEDVLEGLIKEVKVTIGVSNEFNVADGISGDLQSEMLAGDAVYGTYKFIDISGEFDITQNQGRPFSVKVGATANSTNEKLVTFTNDILFNEGLELMIEVDLNEFFTNPNLIDFNNFENGLVNTEAASEQIMNNVQNSLKQDFIE